MRPIVVDAMPAATTVVVVVQTMAKVEETTFPTTHAKATPEEEATVVGAATLAVVAKDLAAPLVLAARSVTKSATPLRGVGTDLKKT
jgi:hypothetical protein